MRAALGGYVEIVQMLIEAGAELNTSDLHGWTALMEAAQKGHLQVVDLLLTAGADPFLANDVSL